MIEIFSDGSCVFKNYEDSDGSYAFVVIQDGVLVHEEKQYIEKGATNNRMELIGFLKALEWIVGYSVSGTCPDYPEITVISDSQIVIKGFNGEWRRKANTDIWESIMAIKDSLTDIINLKAEWVKGHSGNQWNEYVDKLCTSCYPTTEPEPKVDKSDWKIKTDKNLLKEILYCLNQVKNTNVGSDYFKDTYEICSELQKHLKQ